MRDDSRIPEPLRRSVPRRIGLTPAGAGLLIVAAALAAAAVASGIWFYEEAREDERWTAAVNAAEGEVIETRRTRGENPRVRIVFRYTADGVARSATATLRRRDEDRFPAGSRVPVLYSAARPEKAWIESYGPNVTPMWMAMALPPALALPAVVLLFLYRRQARLLSEGRPAVATVVKARRFAGGKAGAFWVTYEWTLMDGARRSGRYQVEKNPPPAGSTLVIVYDRENPKRSIRYPAPLVRLA